MRAAILRKQTTKQTNMKSETDTIISALRVLARDIHTDDGVVNACLDEAAGRLEELQRANQNTLADLAVAIERRDDSYAEIKTVRRELSEAIKERNKTVADLIKQRDEAIASARLEPSRLEIASVLLAAMCGSQYTWTNAEGIALRKADALIAAAKEVK